MARDVEYNVTASDESGMALASAEAKYKASQERIRRESEKTGKSLGDNLTKGVNKAAPDMLSKLQGVFSTGGASGGQLLAIGLAAASPVIGATLSAAIIGGAGVGGVIGGVVLAARDPRVKAAGAQLGQTLLGELEKDAAPFVEPLLRNIAKVEARFGQMNTRISRIFSTSSGFLDPLVDGALNGIDGILRGVDALVAKAGPVIKSFGGAFTIIGDSIGNALTTISGGSEEAASAVTNLAKSIGAAIEATGYLIRGLTWLYGVVSFIPGKINDVSQKLGGFVGHNDAARKSVAGTAGAAAAAAIEIAEMGANAANAAQPVATFADKVNSLAEAGHAAFDSLTDVGAATDRAEEAIKKNGKTLSANTEKGRENRAALSSLATALQKQYEASVKVNGEGVKSNKVAGDNRAAFVRLATQFGLSKKEAEALATKMGLIPAKKDSDFTLNTHDAAGRAKAAQDAIDRIHGKTVTVRVSVTGTERLNALGHRIGGYSAGDLSWAAADRSSGVARTGGPTPVNVSNNVGVYLDGAPFYAMTVRTVRASSERDAWRQKVGAR